MQREDSAGRLENRLNRCLRQFPKVLGVNGTLCPTGLQYLDDTREGLKRVGDLEWWRHGSWSEPVTERHSYFGSFAEIPDYLRALPMELDGTNRVDAVAAEARVRELEAELRRLRGG